VDNSPILYDEENHYVDNSPIQFDGKTTMWISLPYSMTEKTTMWTTLPRSAKGNYAALSGRTDYPVQNPRRCLGLGYKRLSAFAPARRSTRATPSGGKWALSRFGVWVLNGISPLTVEMTGEKVINYEL
jgi:hypothetical protein